MACRPQLHSNLELKKWNAYAFPNIRSSLATPLSLSQLKASGIAKSSNRQLSTKGLILNFYSPICKPCLEELAALGILYQKAQEESVAMFLALSPDLEQHGLTISSHVPLSPKEIRAKIFQRMKKDIIKYNIRIPILVMAPPFIIGRTQFIQATPETLFLHTQPLRLAYNMIGAITHEKKSERILSDTRFQFALQRLKQL